MRLIGSITSPYVRKVRVVLLEKRLDYRFDLEDVWAADTRITEANPLGKVPCLVMEGGEAVFDSRVIVEYVDTLSPVGRLIPDKGRERAEVRTWEALADGLVDALLLARLETTWSGRTDAQRCPAWVEWQMRKVHAALQAMSQGLAQRPWAAGTHMTLADIAVGCALGYLDLRFAEVPWRTTYPNLARLAEKLFLRPSFAETVPTQAR